MSGDEGEKSDSSNPMPEPMQLSAEYQRSSSLAESRCHICSSSTGEVLQCDICFKPACGDHLLPSRSSHESDTARLVCEICDEAILKEEIRAEMQAEILALNRELQTVQESYSKLLVENTAADTELATLQKSYEEELRLQTEAQARLLDRLHADESALAITKEEIASLESTEKTLFADELRMKDEKLAIEEELNRQTDEKRTLEQKQKVMVDGLKLVDKQLKETVGLKKLEGMACDECKAKIQAMMQHRDATSIDNQD